jgi:hypothetical protein
MNSSNLTFIQGDILDYTNDYYIAHQCNCITTTAQGLAKSIFDAYPSANIYADGTDRDVGKIIVRDKIINMLAQNSAGKPKYNETEEMRETYFQECLDNIVSYFPNGAQIAFPCFIGCGLAGGKWINYLYMINNFTNNNTKFKVIIVYL